MFILYKLPKFSWRRNVSAFIMKCIMYGELPFGNTRIILSFFIGFVFISPSILGNWSPLLFAHPSAFINSLKINRKNIGQQQQELIRWKYLSIYLFLFKTDCLSSNVHLELKIKLRYIICCIFRNLLCTFIIAIWSF